MITQLEIEAWSTVTQFSQQKVQVLDRYIEINRLIRGLYWICHEGIDAEIAQAGAYAECIIADVLKRDVRDIRRLWPEDLAQDELTKIEDVLPSLDANAYRSVVTEFIPDLADRIDSYFGSRSSGSVAWEVLDLLHPTVFAASYGNFKAGHYRDAVLNSIVSVFDLIRQRSGSDGDGAKLVGEVFGGDKPALVLSELETESGRSDQKGFLQIFQGAYVGIRNPKAHSLESDMDAPKALQYLIFASMLARRIEDAKVGSHSTKSA